MRIVALYISFALVLVFADATPAPVKLPSFWGGKYDSSTVDTPTSTDASLNATAAEEEEDSRSYNAEEDMIFTLFTNSDRQHGQVIFWNDSSWIRNSSFDPVNPIRLTCHGWQGDNTSEVNYAVRRELFEKGQYNVIMVDWTAGAGTINYIAARNRVEETGEVVAKLLKLISNETGIPYSEMTIIGHSLGGHVAGFAGKNLDGQLGKIVALDPASPFFNVGNAEERLNATDAQYVQVIHTDGGLKGIDVPIGHGDFYPNGGRSQPGCGIDLTGTCAHGRAVAYYVESIQSTTGFWARNCNSYEDVVENRCKSNAFGVLMGGEPVDTNAVGVFYLTTNEESPFAKGQS